GRPRERSCARRWAPIRRPRDKAGGCTPASRPFRSQRSRRPSAALRGPSASYPYLQTCHHSLKRAAPPLPLNVFFIFSAPATTLLGSGSAHGCSVSSSASSRTERRDADLGSTGVPIPVALISL